MKQIYPNLSIVDSKFEMEGARHQIVGRQVLVGPYMRGFLLTAWLIAILLGYIGAAFLMAGSLNAAKAVAETRHAERLDRDKTEASHTKVDKQALASIDTSSQVKIETGIYIDRISRVSIPESIWDLDFYIWFNWKDAIASPGEHIHIVDGEILKKELETRIPDSGIEEPGNHYELWRVTAKVTKFFNTARFPRDDHLLVLEVEDAQRPIGEIVYVPDIEGSATSSRVKVPGYEIYETTIVEKPHSYRTSRGDPRLPEGQQATYSQLIYAIAIHRPGLAIYIKMFLGTFAAVAIGVLSLLIKSSHIGPRYSVAGASFFAAVASTYVVSRLLPQTGDVGLTDYVTGASLVSIVLIILTSTMSLSMPDTTDGRNASRYFDIGAIGVFSAGFIFLNVVIARAASL